MLFSTPVPPFKMTCQPRGRDADHHGKSPYPDVLPLNGSFYRNPTFPCHGVLVQDESLVGRGCLGPFHLFIDKLNFSSKALNGNYYNMAVTHDQLLIFFFPLRPGNKMLNVPLLTLKTPSRHLHSRRAVYIFFFFFFKSPGHNPCPTSTREGHVCNCQGLLSGRLIPSGGHRGRSGSR